MSVSIPAETAAVGCGGAADVDGPGTGDCEPEGATGGGEALEASSSGCINSVETI